VREGAGRLAGLHRRVDPAAGEEGLDQVRFDASGQNVLLVGKGGARYHVITGAGDVLEPEHDVTAIGSGGNFALAAARRIAGSGRIVMASVDTDGTDGPGTQFAHGEESIPCLAGGVVDGFTCEEAAAAGVDLVESLRRHDATPALWRLGSGVVAESNISLNDLTVALIMRDSKEGDTV